MAKNTALGAEKSKKRNITFKNKEHEKFYHTYLPKCRYQDTYHKALVYCMGLSEDTRRNVNRIYDFETGFIKRSVCRKDGRPAGAKRLSVLHLISIQMEHLRQMNMTIRRNRLLRHGFIPSVTSFAREMPDIFGKQLKSGIRITVSMWIGRICFMLKIRLQGTVRDIRWFKRLLEKHPEIRVLQTSEIFSNKGTNRYFRSYAEIERTEKEER